MRTTPRRTPKGAWIVLSVATLAYVSAILQRTTMGVSGVTAAERFHVSAESLSLFVVVQLIVYAAMQIPVGILLDRFGTRVMLVLGAVVMGVSQFIVGQTSTLGLAIAARALVGAGDAMIFISALRIVPAWFQPNQVPLVSQILGIVGQFGQVLSAIPFLIILDVFGWTPAHVSAAAFAIIVAAICLAMLRDVPPGVERPHITIRFSDLRKQILVTGKSPGTRLAIWTHWITMFGSALFTMLWGVPFMVKGLGLSQQVASGMLTMLIFVNIMFGLVLGAMSARMPQLRVRMVLAIVSVSALAWASVILWPGTPPFWLLVVLVITLAFGGPASMIAFEFAREHNPALNQGLATGMANIGGYTATLLSTWLVGRILDAVHHMNPDVDLYSLGSFKIAFVAVLVITAIGVTGFLHANRVLARKKLV